MKTTQAILCLAGVALVAGLVAWIMAPEAAAVTVSVAALLFTIAQRRLATPSASVTVRRLYRQQMLGGIFLIITGLLMCNQVWLWTVWFHHNEWMVALAIACVLQCYSAFRLPYAIKAEQQKHTF